MKLASPRHALAFALIIGAVVAVVMIAYAGTGGADVQPVPQPAQMTIPF